MEKKYKILFVDDEANILMSLKRIFFRNNDLEIHTATSGKLGLEILEKQPIDLVVSDQKMPEMSGNQFLKEVKNKYPNTIRLILTGYSEINSIIDSINSGEVYRYLTKPWNDEDLKLTLYNALEFKKLQEQNGIMTRVIKEQNEQLKIMNAGLEEKVKERTQQLENSLKQVVKISHILRQNINEIISLLVGIISSYNKYLGAHSKRVAEIVKVICQDAFINKKECELIVNAALLHDIGLLEANSHIINQDFDNLNDDHKKIFYDHPILGESLISTIKNFEPIAKIIRHHHEMFNGGGFPDNLKKNAIPIGSRIIYIVNDYDDMIYKKHMVPEDAYKSIQNNSTNYDPEIQEIFLKIIKEGLNKQMHSPENIMIKDLKEGMYLIEDIFLENGVLLLPKGISINQAMLNKILKFAAVLNIDNKVKVYQ